MYTIESVDQDITIVNNSSLLIADWKNKENYNLPNQRPKALPSSTVRVNMSKLNTALEMETVSAFINLSTACPYQE